MRPFKKGNRGIRKQQFRKLDRWRNDGTRTVFSDSVSASKFRSPAFKANFPDEIDDWPHGLDRATAANKRFTIAVNALG